MKKIKNGKKLEVQKEKVTALSHADMRHIAGGSQMSTIHNFLCGLCTNTRTINTRQPRI